MGKILKRINDEESARDCENSIQTIIRELDDVSRRLLRLEIPIDQTEAKKMSAAIDRAVNAFEWNQQLSRLRANGFYGLGKYFTPVPDGIDIVRPLDGYTSYWDKIENVTVESEYRKDLCQQVRDLQCLEDALRINKAEIEESELKAIESLVGKVVNVKKKEFRSMLREKRTDFYECYLLEKRKQAWVDLCDQYLLLQEANYLNASRLKDALEPLDAAIRAYYSESVKNYNEYVHTRTRLLHLYGKGHYYPIDRR